MAGRTAFIPNLTIQPPPLAEPMKRRRPPFTLTSRSVHTTTVQGLQRRDRNQTPVMLHHTLDHVLHTFFLSPESLNISGAKGDSEL